MTLLQYTTGVKITRRDATVEAYTSHDKSLTVGGTLYRSTAAYTPTGTARNVELIPDNQDISGIIDGVYVTKDGLRAGDYDGARLQAITIDWSTSTQVDILLVGYLGRWTIQNNQYRIEFNSLEAEYGKPVGRTVSLKCPWDVGDSDCGFTLTPVTSTVTGQGSPANRLFIDTTRTEADGFFDGGKVTFTSGNNNNRSMDVKKWTLSTKTFELYEPLFADIETADGYSATQGCDKTFETCRDTFTNLTPTGAKGFGGFNYLPGITDIIGKQTD